MRTRRRGTYRTSHHPVVHCEGDGRWHWRCGCGARGGATSGKWQVAVTAALAHHSTNPGE